MKTFALWGAAAAAKSRALPTHTLGAEAVARADQDSRTLLAQGREFARWP